MRVRLEAIKPRVFLWLIAAGAIAISVQQVLRNRYNNYLTFTTSLKVLLAHQSLYVPHPEYHEDLFKYSPTFPLFMAPFTWQPLLTGLICWNLLNGLALYAAVRAVFPDDRRAVVALALMSIELITSLQNVQSNALVAACAIVAYAEMERQRNWRAGLSIAAGFFIKGYGAVAGLLALVFPQRFRIAGAAAACGLALALAPLIILSPRELAGQYAEWVGVRGTFTPTSNASVMRVWLRYVDPETSPLVIQAIGGLLLLLPFARVHAWRDPAFRLRLLCSLLVALVIFNNSAEPATYILAVSGGAMWYAAGPPRGRVDRAVSLGLLLGVSLISTDLYPRAWRATIGPYTFKAMGCLILWIRMNWELWRFRIDSSSA